MSVSYSAIQWNRQKRIYDLIVFLFVLLVFSAYCAVTLYFNPQTTVETLLIRGSSLSAILLLHFTLSIGPLARIDSRFLPLLYNRRHLGVFTCLLSCVHASLSVFQFHALGNIPARLSVLESYPSDFKFWKPEGDLTQIPFEPFGLVALFILIFMAATSHDFWLKNLGASLWKKIHVLVYVAYFSLIIHVAYGFLQSELHPIYAGLLTFGMGWLAFVHGWAYWLERRRYPLAQNAVKNGFHFVCHRSGFVEGRARIFDVEGKRIAFFEHKNEIKAVSNVCRHQGGPLGEGRVIDGCITCPWHGWQYRPDDGCSPPPFREVIPTFEVRVEGDQVYVNPTERLAVLPKLEVAQ